MKLLLKLYDRCKTPIRVVYFAFLLIAFGTLVQSESVNIFYTFKNSLFLTFADGCLRLGQTLILNVPLIFMLNLVCKRANSGVPIILAIIGYATFVMTMSLYAPQGLPSQNYMSGTGILPLAFNGKYPLETGIFGPFVVAYMVRIAFIHSRHRTSHSILGFLKKDSAAVIYTIVLCALTGLGFSYAMPFMYNYLGRIITHISSDLMDPYKIGMYGVLDRVMSMFGLGASIRYPFWYTSAGGSFQTISGQSVLGDVNIWSYVKGVDAGFVGAGRFITPYFIINIFVIPALVFATWISFTDRSEKGRLILPVIFASLLSIICGNPLPYELTMLFVSPGLLAIYLFIVWVLFFACTKLGIFLGSPIASTYIASAMPGSFADLIINIRSVFFFDTIVNILIVGAVAFTVALLLTIVYYRYLSGGVRSKEIANDIIEAVGGADNIIKSTSGFYRVDLYLRDPENISFDDIRKLGSYRVIETKDGLSMEFGVASFAIARNIMSNLPSIVGETN